MKIKLPTLKIDNLKIRTIKLRDSKYFFKIGSSYEVVKYLNWGPYKNKEDAVFDLKNHYFKKKKDDLPTGYSIISNKKCIGWIEFYNDLHIKNSIMLGFVLAKEEWDKGYMSKILDKVIDLCYNYLGYDKIIMITISSNLVARHLAKKFGFMEIDKRDYQHFNSKIVISDKMITFIKVKTNLSKEEEK
ncbi:MAG: GNAT family N-acetyltransferase [Acholeplasmatales bacterium]|jgi:ribosomal-protein-alanine N-acetyltransferase|nr:GNAT family N-acetyltransferase [Acholeplasmatales bacterium]